VAVQEVRWDRGGTKPAGEYTFFMETEGACGSKAIKTLGYTLEGRGFETR
jgi:hypothetical protein